MSSIQELLEELNKAHEEHLQAMIATKKAYAAYLENHRLARELDQKHSKAAETNIAAEKRYNKILAEYLEAAMKETSPSNHIAVPSLLVDL